jgi:hypothetical protein
MHDVLSVGITIATILAAAFFSAQSTNNLRTEVIGKLDAIQRDQREFYAEQARHDVRISNLEHHK